MNDPVEYGVPWRASPSALLVRARNPSPMTLDGTNTWLLAAPDSEQALVADPGPDDEVHLATVLRIAAEHGLRVVGVLLTHGHPDHAAGAAHLAALAGGVGVRALDPVHRLGAEGLADGDVVAAGDLAVRVIATPGHTADSLCFHLPEDGAVLTGDTVLGTGTTVVAHPDGRLADYLGSLHRLRALVDEASATTLLTGHGRVLYDAASALDFYLTHRAERLAQVERAVATVGHDPQAVVETVYADVDRALWPAAELSVRAQLDYLAERADP